MEDARIGEWVRSERRRAGLRQVDLAERAGVGRSTVARVENGLLSELTIRAARAVATAVGIQLPFAPRSRRGASIERQVDWRHAALVEAVLRRLARFGWETAPEYSFNRYGDRGSVDVLAWHREARALLIVEAKSDLRNVQETLHALDIKRRVVPALVRAERGWGAESLGVVMVLSDLRVERGRIAGHGSTFEAALPARTVEVRHWLEKPQGGLRGSGFCRLPALRALCESRRAKDGSERVEGRQRGRDLLRRGGSCRRSPRERHALPRAGPEAVRKRTFARGRAQRS